MSECKFKTHKHHHRIALAVAGIVLASASLFAIAAETNNSNVDNAGNAVAERQKWETEKAFREREVLVKEREQSSRDAELAIKEKEQATFWWQSPLLIAIIAAGLALMGNAGVAFMNGLLERKLENLKSEQARILEMIKTGNPDKAATNLSFLLDAGLVSDSELREKLEKFLSNREPGKGPTLPSFSYEKEHPSFKNVSPEWLAASAKPNESVNAIWVGFVSKAGKHYKAIHVFHHPSGPYILLCSTDKNRKDFVHVETVLSKEYGGTPEKKITDRGSDICDVIYVPQGFTQTGLAEKVDKFFRHEFDDIVIEEANY